MICRCSTNCLYIKQNAVLQQCWVITTNFHHLKLSHSKKVSLDRILIPAWWLLYYMQLKISSLQQKAKQLLWTHPHLELTVCWYTNPFKKWSFLLFLMRTQTLNGYLFIQCLVASLEQGRNIIWQVLQELPANWWQTPSNMTGQGNWKLSRSGGAWFVFSLKEWFDKRWHQSRYTGWSHTKPSHFESCPLILPSDYEFVCWGFLTKISTLGFNYSLLMEPQAGVIKASWNLSRRRNTSG